MRNMAQHPIHPDPLRLAALMERAAAATQRAAPGKQKRYALALGISDSRASRHMRSDDPYSPAVRLLAAVDALASGDGTSAFAFLAEAYATAMEALSKRTTADLIARLREYGRRRIDAEANLQRALADEYERGSLYGSEAVDAARIALAEIDIELSVTRRILREREERNGR